jgi:tetratricopeptide (TPR) repeat protein
MRVSLGVVDRLQADYFAGRDPGRSFSHIDEVQAAVIVAETLEADRLANMPPDKLFDGSFEPLFGPVSDWPRAVMVELLFATADLAKETGDRRKHRDFWAFAWAALEECLNSPVASPMLWYEDIFFDVGHQLRVREDLEAVDLFKRCLAHDLRFSEGRNVVPALQDLAETYLWVGDLDAGLEILTGLLRHDPSHIWTYNLMAYVFEQFGLIEIGKEAARRGLELVEVTGDPEDVEAQLRDSMDNLRESKQGGREAEVDPEVLGELRDALALDFDAGEHGSVVALSHDLVPDLDEVPVMRPPEKPDLPPPEVVLKRLKTSSPEAARPDRDLGRNDPCWCGSGKKYKYCHLRSDQKRRRS